MGSQQCWVVYRYLVIPQYYNEYRLITKNVTMQWAVFGIVLPVPVSGIIKKFHV